MAVYTQGTDNTIYESHWERGWDAAKAIATDAKAGSPIAAVALKSGSSVSVHVFYIGSRFDIIKEIVSVDRGAWSTGSIPQVTASSQSRLAATITSYNNPHDNIALYYQDDDGSIKEMQSKDVSWNRGGYEIISKEKARLGTGLAVLAFDGYGAQSDGTRLYYQRSDKTIVEAHRDPNRGGTWVQQGITFSDAVEHSNIAAYAYSRSTADNNSPQLDVQFINDNATLIERLWQVGGWFGAVKPLEECSAGQASSGSGIAITSAYTPDSLRLYYQNGSGQIQELVRNNEGSNWQKGSTVP